jgi:hypothetical protein
MKTETTRTANPQGSINYLVILKPSGKVLFREPDRALANAMAAGATAASSLCEHAVVEQEALDFEAIEESIQEYGIGANGGAR